MHDELFIKRCAFMPRAQYPDYGCNTETFTNDEMLEVETLEAILKIGPEGVTEHIETWSLNKAQIGEDDAGIDRVVLSLVK